MRDYGPSPVSGWTDEVLAKAVRLDGDREAFAELYRRYAGRVRGWAVNRRRRNAAEAEDLAADVFCEALAWLRAPEGDPAAYRIGSPFSNWLFGVVARDVDRRSRRAWWRHAKAIRWACEEVFFAARDGRGADPAGRLGGELGAAVAALPETDRRVIELRYADGYTIEAAAAALGISENQVRCASRRALRKLGRAERHRPAGARIYQRPDGTWRGYVIVPGPVIPGQSRPRKFFDCATRAEAEARGAELAARVTRSDRILAAASGAAGGCIRIIPPEGTQ